jgi:hypothetical protein
MKQNYILMRLTLIIVVLSLWLVNLNAQIVSHDFNSDANGWYFPKAGIAHMWKRIADKGVDNTGCLYAKLDRADDYAASPAISLEAGVEYTAAYRLSVVSSGPRDIYLGINTIRDTLGRTLLACHKDFYSGFGEKITKFTVSKTGTYYFLFYLVEGGYKDMYVDNFIIEKKSPPTISITNPKANATYKEGDILNIKATATDSDGSIKKFDVYEGAELIKSLTDGNIDFNWTEYYAGQKTLRFVATDNRGYETELTRDITTNFADGTLNELLHYNFNNSKTQGWTFINSGTSAWKSNGSGYNVTTSIFGQSLKPDDLMVSPRLFYIKGQQYKLQFSL